jgi:acyl-CoA thioesterase I
MLPILWYMANGQTFFWGCLGIVISVLLSKYSKPLLKLASYLILSISVFFIVLSGTPFNIYFYIVWSVLAMIWFYYSYITKRSDKKIKGTVSKLLLIAITVAGVSIELPYHLKPNPPIFKSHVLYVIGDSISDGIGGKNEITWPEIIAKKHNVDVINLAQSGATLKSAMKQAEKINRSNATIILEIGGNDLFWQSTVSDFENNLEVLIQKIPKENNFLYMLELPLPVMHHFYGRSQRDLAKKYNITLIPKRYFVKVISTKEATVDLAHLSQEGQYLMSEIFWPFVEKNFN